MSYEGCERFLRSAGWGILTDRIKCACFVAVIGMVGCQFQEATLGDAIDASAIRDGSGEADAMAEDVDRGLLARYQINEAVSGQGPLALQDDSEAGITLPLVYVQNSPRYEEDVDGNRLLRFDSADEADTGGARRPIIGTILETLDGATQATLCVKYSVTACVDTDHRVFGFSNSGSEISGGWFIIREGEGVEALGVRWSDDTAINPRYRMSKNCPGSAEQSPVTVHWVIDTLEAIPQDRVRAYIDGAKQFVSPQQSDATFPTLGATIDLRGTANTPTQLVLGAPASGYRTANMRIWYAAVFNVALEDNEISAQVAHLAQSDD